MGDYSVVARRQAAQKKQAQARKAAQLSAAKLQGAVQSVGNSIADFTERAAGVPQAPNKGAKRSTASPSPAPGSIPSLNAGATTDKVMGRKPAVVRQRQDLKRFAKDVGAHNPRDLEAVLSLPDGAADALALGAQARRRAFGYQQRMQGSGIVPQLDEHGPWAPGSPQWHQAEDSKAIQEMVGKVYQIKTDAKAKAELAKSNPFLKQTTKGVSKAKIYDAEVQRGVQGLVHKPDDWMARFARSTAGVPLVQVAMKGLNQLSMPMGQYLLKDVHNWADLTPQMLTAGYFKNIGQVADTGGVTPSQALAERGWMPKDKGAALLAGMVADTLGNPASFIGVGELSAARAALAERVAMRAVARKNPYPRVTESNPSTWVKPMMGTDSVETALQTLKRLNQRPAHALSEAEKAQIKALREIVGRERAPELMPKRKPRGPTDYQDSPYPAGNPQRARKAVPPRQRPVVLDPSEGRPVVPVLTERVGDTPEARAQRGRAYTQPVPPGTPAPRGSMNVLHQQMEEIAAQIPPGSRRVNPMTAKISLKNAQVKLGERAANWSKPVKYVLKRSKPTEHQAAVADQMFSPPPRPETGASMPAPSGPSHRILGPDVIEHQARREFNENLPWMRARRKDRQPEYAPLKTTWVPVEKSVGVEQLKGTNVRVQPFLKDGKPTLKYEVKGMPKQVDTPTSFASRDEAVAFVESKLKRKVTKEAEPMSREEMSQMVEQDLWHAVFDKYEAKDPEYAQRLADATVEVAWTHRHKGGHNAFTRPLKHEMPAENVQAVLDRVGTVTKKPKEKGSWTDSSGNTHLPDAEVGDRYTVAWAQSEGVHDGIYAATRRTFDTEAEAKAFRDVPANSEMIDAVKEGYWAPIVTRVRHVTETDPTKAGMTMLPAHLSKRQMTGGVTAHVGPTRLKRRVTNEPPKQAKTVDPLERTPFTGLEQARRTSEAAEMRVQAAMEAAKEGAQAGDRTVARIENLSRQVQRRRNKVDNMWIEYQMEYAKNGKVSRAFMKDWKKKFDAEVDALNEKELQLRKYVNRQIELGQNPGMRDVLQATREAAVARLNYETVRRKVLEDYRSGQQRLSASLRRRPPKPGRPQTEAAKKLVEPAKPMGTNAPPPDVPPYEFIPKARGEAIPDGWLADSGVRSHRALMNAIIEVEKAKGRVALGKAQAAMDRVMKQYEAKARAIRERVDKEMAQVDMPGEPAIFKDFFFNSLPRDIVSNEMRAAKVYQQAKQDSNLGFAIILPGEGNFIPIPIPGSRALLSKMRKSENPFVQYLMSISDTVSGSLRYWAMTDYAARKKGEFYYDPVVAAGLRAADNFTMWANNQAFRWLTERGKKFKEWEREYATHYLEGDEIGMTQALGDHVLKPERDIAIKQYADEVQAFVERHYREAQAQGIPVGEFVKNYVAHYVAPRVYNRHLIDESGEMMGSVGNALRLGHGRNDKTWMHERKYNETIREIEDRIEGLHLIKDLDHIARTRIASHNRAIADYAFYRELARSKGIDKTKPETWMQNRDFRNWLRDEHADIYERVVSGKEDFAFLSNRKEIKDALNTWSMMSEKPNPAEDFASAYNMNIFKAQERAFNPSGEAHGQFFHNIPTTGIDPFPKDITFHPDIYHQLDGWKADQARARQRIWDMANSPVRGLGTKSTQVWKEMALLTLGYDVRNMIGDMILLSQNKMHPWQSVMRGVLVAMGKDKAYRTGWEAITRKRIPAGRMTYRDLKEGAQQRGVANSGQLGGEVTIPRKEVQNARGARRVLGPARATMYHAGAPIRGIRALRTGRENLARYGAYARLVGTKHLDPATAARMTRKALYDYRDVGKAVARLRNNPLGMPFVTWLVKNVPAQMRLAFENPRSLVELNAAMQNSYAQFAPQDFPYDPKNPMSFTQFMPESAKKQVWFGTPWGQTTLQAPQTDINRLPYPVAAKLIPGLSTQSTTSYLEEAGLSNLSPLLQAGYMGAFNRNPYSHREFSKTGLSPISGIEEQIQRLPLMDQVLGKPDYIQAFDSKGQRVVVRAGSHRGQAVLRALVPIVGTIERATEPLDPTVPGREAWRPAAGLAGFSSMPYVNLPSLAGELTAKSIDLSQFHGSIKRRVQTKGGYIRHDVLGFFQNPERNRPPVADAMREYNSELKTWWVKYGALRFYAERGDYKWPSGVRMPVH